MGCTESKANLPFEMMMQFADFQKNLEDFRLLQLSIAKVRTLYNMYDFIAGAEGSECSLYTFVTFLGISPTVFTQQVFTLFATGKFDFRTFILSVWNYCTLTSKNMRKRFIFVLFLCIYLHFVSALYRSLCLRSIQHVRQASHTP